ncbi:helix-turn-helix domain-containing protein [Chitinophaga vietnamensis]|uniref:helix-turn-helix domain-containing protein n=1 Tax=Chitinophaga vietnamensis TaxID=2593957 RepID=UPI0011782CAF|nr:helix-turn-helix domain-containing protein [Chitinophaga vietnamensis]
MSRNNLYEPFEVHTCETDVCPVTAQRHNFFELIFIRNGTGEQVVNDNVFHYRPGDLFLVTPEDAHFFRPHQTTSFFFLRFNDIYIKSATVNAQRMEFILQHASHQPGCILFNADDKPIVQAIVTSLVRERNQQQLYHREVIQQLVNTFITIVARNIAMKLPARINDNSGMIVMDIIRYIQEHIYTPELLKAEAVAKHAGISVSYLGRYFKKHTGENMQDYIMQYKMKLVETRLRHSDMRINEIAWELSFTDESHLNRLFKKYKGMNPSAFRKQQAAAMH